MYVLNFYSRNKTNGGKTRVDLILLKEPVLFTNNV